jgi:hypothetical protein
MCILNGIQFWPLDAAILHIFSRKSKTATPISMHPRGATKGVCEQVICDAYDKRFTTIK